MAATVSAWTKAGAWALDSEQNEDELVQQDNRKPIPESDFPSLADVAKTKSKKKKPQTLSLGEFSTYTGPEKKFFQKGVVNDELLVLPTAPRERTEEELNQSRLGGGFRCYDTNRGGSDDSRRGFNRDSIDNWGAGKKSINGGFGGRERGVFFVGDSRADEVDSWGANKAGIRGGFFGDSRRGVGFESSGGADGESWGKKKKEFGGSFDSLRRGGGEAGNGDSESWGRRKEEGHGPGTRPRLNLQPRTKPLEEVVLKGSDEVVKVKGLNPFGEARPREEVLKEKGQDWKEIDDKLEALKVKEIKQGSGDGKKGFGFSNGRGSSTERAWRKPDVVEPPRSETSENGHVEEPQDGEQQA